MSETDTPQIAIIGENRFAINPNKFSESEALERLTKILRKASISFYSPEDPIASRDRSYFAGILYADVYTGGSGTPRENNTLVYICPTNSKSLRYKLDSKGMYVDGGGKGTTIITFYDNDSLMIGSNRTLLPSRFEDLVREASS